MTAIPSTPAPGAASANAIVEPSVRCAFAPQERELLDAISRYARTDDLDDLAAMGGLYIACVRATTIGRRLQLLHAVTAGVADGTIGVRALHPFLFHEPQPRVIAEATSRAAVHTFSDPGDPLHGARELAGYAREAARRGEEARAIGLFAGVVVLGAPFAAHCAGPCWRSLAPQGRVRLARLIRRQATPSIGGWLAEWMEECAGSEFAEVAKTVAALARHAGAHPLVPVELEPSNEEWDHRRAYKGFNAWRDSLHLEQEAPPTVAVAVAGEILLSQLNVVTLQLTDRGADVAALHAALRRPWALGYVLGVAYATLGASGVARGEDSFTDAVTWIHRRVYGRMASADLLHLSRTAQRSPDFDEGARAGRDDTASFFGEVEQVLGLAAWLSQRLVGGDASR